MANWDKKSAVVDVQVGGPGNPYQILGTISDNDVVMSGLSGGGQATEPDYARDLSAGAGQYVAAGTHTTGNPDPYTFSLMKRLRAPLADVGVNILRQKFGCLHNVRVRQGCNDPVIKTNYVAMKVMNYVNATGFSDDSNLADGTVGDGTPVMQQIDEQAVDLIDLNKPSHVNIQGTVVDFDINDVISVGVRGCAGICGPANDGDQDFWMVTDRDDSPGYLSNATPLFIYTRDGGGSFASSYIGSLQVADAVALVKSGGYVVVASSTATNGGIAYALFQDILDGAGAPWGKATGITATKEPRAIAALGGLIWAAGTGGYIYRSTDGPFAFTAISAAAHTTQNFNAVAIADENLAYFAANAGVIVKYENGVLSLLTLTNSAGATVTTANINTIVVPKGSARGSEVYIGTADGKIFRSKSKGAAGTWEERTFDKSGNGSVGKIGFGGPDGVFMFVVQNDVGGVTSRVLRDLSGGALGQDVEIIGGFTTPGNGGYNSIAASSPNVAMVVGNKVNGYGYIGKIS